MNFLGANEALLLVHREMPTISRVKRYDLMLTPQFYIFKKESLPVSYQYQALKLAPSILDELTGVGNYSYAAIKEDDGWALIAYDMAKIETFLEARGLSKNFINKIYFAQQAKERFGHPVSVDEKNAIVTVDNTVVMLSKSIVGVEECGMLTNAFRPEKGITPSQNRQTWMTQKQAIVISVFLLLLAGAYFAEGLQYRRAIASAKQKIENVKQKYPQLKDKTTYVLNNLYETNHAIDMLQRKMRDRLKTISRMTSKTSKIDSLKIDTKQYEVLIGTDAKHMKELKKYAKSQHLTVLDNNQSLQLKGAL